MKLVLRLGARQIELADLPDSEVEMVLDSRSALLLRARTRRHLTRAKLASALARKKESRARSTSRLTKGHETADEESTQKDIKSIQKRLERIENGASKTPRAEFLHELAEELGQPENGLVMPPYAVARALEELAKLLSLQVVGFGQRLASDFEGASKQARDLAAEFGKGVFSLSGDPDAKNLSWLAELYRTATRVDAVSSPRFISRARDMWDEIFESHERAQEEAQSAHAPFRIRRIYIDSDECDWREIADKDKLSKKFFIRRERAERLLKRWQKRHSRYGDVRSAPDFAVVDGVVVGVTKEFKDDRPVDVYYFGQLHAKKFGQLFDALLEDAEEYCCS